MNTRKSPEKKFKVFFPSLQAAELGMRMSSMDNATKNCGEVLAGLRLLYNRQRQAAITTVKNFFFSPPSRHVF